MAYIPIATLDDLSSVQLDRVTQRASLADYALSRGAARLQKQDLEGASVEFKRAIAFDPGSATGYLRLGQTYTLMGRSADAVTALERAVETDETDTDARSELAKAYLQTGRYADAELQYLKVLEIEPTSAGVVASLGYLAMQTGRLDEAQSRFERAVRMAPRDPAAHYSLGLVLNKQGEYDAAISSFERAIELRHDYATAYADMAFSYLGLDDKDTARSIADQLWDMGTSQSQSLASELELAMRTPKIAYAEVGDGTFNPILGAGTPLYMLDSALATPGASKNLTMVFQFNQAMDRGSIQNVFNWSILAASGGDAGMYNNGVTLDPTKQVYLMPIPISVTYDPLTYKATVTFKVSQNATGDGVIDPQHWVFRFTGVDASGNRIDPDGDQYDGFARGAF